MPRIKDPILNCSIYLYESEQDAQTGEKSGGSGFIVTVPSPSAELQQKKMGYFYAVTNSHVIKEGKSSVIRINTRDGRTRILRTEASEWHFHPNGDDLAIRPFTTDWSEAQLLHIPTRLFVTKQLMAAENIGAGDEVFTIGRFIGYDGKQKNEPIVRFGNLSISTTVPIKHTRGYYQDSFLIESRSLSGFSGAPVFVHILPFSKRPDKEGWSSEKGPWLLGVDWAHKSTYEPVLEKQQDEYGHDIPIEEGWRVRANSGISCVVPAWKLEELLNIRELVEIRKTNDKRVIEIFKQAREKKGN